MTATLTTARPRTAATYQPGDVHGALLVAAEAVRVAQEFGLPAPTGIGVGPTGVIEAAMPMADLLGWQKMLDKPRVVVDERHGAVLVRGWFERRPWAIRSLDTSHAAGAW